MILLLKSSARRARLHGRIAVPATAKYANVPHTILCPLNVFNPALDGPIWRRAVRDRSQVAGLIGKLTSTGNNQFTNCDLLWFRPTRIVSFCSSLEDRSEQRLKTQGIGSSEANRHRLASVNLPDKQFRDRFRAVFLLSVVISHDSSAKDHARRNARDGRARVAGLLLGLLLHPYRAVAAAALSAAREWARFAKA